MNSRRGAGLAVSSLVVKAHRKLGRTWKREVPVAAREAEPGAPAKGEVERDLSVEGASDLEAVGHESGGRGKDPGSFG